MPRALAVLVVLAACRPAAAPTPTLDLTKYTLVDLSHSFSGSTLYWPTSPSAFALTPIHVGPTPAGFYYSAYTLSTPEHGGTHLDAPVHFDEKGVSVERVPLDRLVAPAVVIDVSAKAASDPDYRLTVADVEAFEAKHGAIAAGSIVLLRTG